MEWTNILYTEMASLNDILNIYVSSAVSYMNL